MAVKHNYLNTAGFKPTALEIDRAELVVNLADGTLWSENVAGTVIKIGGGTYTQGTGISISGDTISAVTHAGGDVTGDVNLTIGTGVVDLAMMADIATDSFIGRTTATSGVPEVLSSTDALAILGVESGAEQNNISDVNATALTDTGSTTLHTHEIANINGVGTSATVDTGTTSGTIPLLTTGGKIPDAMIPALAITETSTVATEVAQLALTVQEGDVAIRTDESKSYVALNDTNASMADWAELLSPTGTATVLGYTSSATQGEVTNTTGANAIIPTATSAGGTNIAGLLTPAQFDKLTNTTNTNSGDNAVNSLYSGLETNADTTIATGTRTATTYPVNLDGGGTYSYLLATATLAGIMPSADKVTVDHITVTQDVDLDSGALTGEAV